MLYLSCSSSNIQQIMQLSPLAPVPETQTNQLQKAVHVAIDSRFKHSLLKNIYITNFFLFSSLRRKKDLAVFQSQRFSVSADGRAVISLLLKWKKDIHQLLELGAKINSSNVVKAIQSGSFSMFVKQLNAVNNKKKALKQENLTNFSIQPEYSLLAYLNISIDSKYKFFLFLIQNGLNVKTQSEFLTFLIFLNTDLHQNSICHQLSLYCMHCKL